VIENIYDILFFGYISINTMLQSFYEKNRHCTICPAKKKIYHRTYNQRHLLNHLHLQKFECVGKEESTKTGEINQILIMIAI